MFDQSAQIHHSGDPSEATIVVDDPGGSYRFGEYLARPGSRNLTRRGERVDVGSRAFDLLIVLLRSPCQIVSKDEIVRYVWPSTTVDESNLRFQMATLRKALGAERDRIKTIPGRGYLFVADERPSFARKGVDDTGDNGQPEQPAIVIIDHDPENRAALQRLLQPFHALVRSFGSMEAFLESQTVRST